jgi:preprotein translocase subunit YajC
MKILQTLDLQVLAQATPAAPGANDSGGGGLVMLGMYALFFAGIYFLMIAPQRKRQKEVEKLQSELSVGDEVLIFNGIYARVVSIDGSKLMLEIENGRMQVDRSVITAKASSTAVTK